MDDWSRLAEPQLDRYDTSVTLAFAERLGYARPAHPGCPRLFDGAVALVPAPEVFGRGYVAAPSDHLNIGRADAALRLWSPGFAQVRELLDSVHAVVSSPPCGDRVVGCTSGPGRTGFGSVAATLDHHVGFAEALVHEMAHHKLHALGVHLEQAERLILNSPVELYPSPIRYDRLRPMPAVLQAQYSYIYVAALDVAVVAAGREAGRDWQVAQGTLATVLPKLEFGRRVIRDHARTDAAGTAFLRGLFQWLDRVLAEGHRVLERLDITPRPFVHPLLGANQQVFAPLPAAALRPQRVTDVLECELDDELLLYAPGRSMAFSLNASSRAVWRQCHGAATLGDIAEDLAGVYGVGRAALEDDVVNAVAQLSAFGLLVPHGPPEVPTVRGES